MRRLILIYDVRVISSLFFPAIKFQELLRRPISEAIADSCLFSLSQ